MGYGKWVAFTMDPTTRQKTIIESGAAGPGLTDPHDIKRHWSPGRIMIGWEPDEADQQIKKLAPSTLAKRRRNALRKNLQITVPLFADQLEQLELNKRPDFYRGK